MCKWVSDKILLWIIFFLWSCENNLLARSILDISHWWRGPSFLLGGCEWKALPPESQMAQSNSWRGRANCNNPRPHRAFWTWWIELCWCVSADNACISGNFLNHVQQVVQCKRKSASSLVIRLRVWTLRLCFRKIHRSFYFKIGPLQKILYFRDQ